MIKKYKLLHEFELTFIADTTPWKLCKARPCATKYNQIWRTCHRRPSRGTWDSSLPGTPLRSCSFRASWRSCPLPLPFRRSTVESSSTTRHVIPIRFLLWEQISWTLRMRCEFYFIQLSTYSFHLILVLFRLALCPSEAKRIHGILVENSKFSFSIGVKQRSAYCWLRRHVGNEWVRIPSLDV